MKFVGLPYAMCPEINQMNLELQGPKRSKQSVSDGRSREKTSSDTFSTSHCCVVVGSFFFVSFCFFFVLGWFSHF